MQDQDTAPGPYAGTTVTLSAEETLIVNVLVHGVAWFIPQSALGWAGPHDTEVAT